MEFDKLKEIIADVLNVDPSEITPETKFVDDLGADSLDLYQIVVGMEEAFDQTVDQDKVESVVTVQDALTLIKEATAKS